jgi:hypothetical protein
MRKMIFFLFFFLFSSRLITAPKQVEFKQRTEAPFVELKQVEGSNAGGTTTTPYRNLDEWFSEAIFSRPTERTEINDPLFNHKPTAVAAPETEAPRVKAATPQSKGPGMGQMGGFNLGGSASKQDQTADQNDALRLSMMQQGEIGKKKAETSRAEKERQAARLKAKIAADRRRQNQTLRLLKDQRRARTITID